MAIPASIQLYQQTAEFILDLYRQYGDDDYIGEPVSQIQHMHQAAELADEYGYDEEVILAAFFHDIGHFCEHLMHVTQMDGFGVVDHEKLRADFLRSKGFSKKIGSLVENHVQAKRYLTLRQTDYYQRLSDASKATLEFQGGVMKEEEALLFEQDPLFELHIQLRKWDELAKVNNQQRVPLEHYGNMMIRHLSNQS